MYYIVQLQILFGDDLKKFQHRTTHRLPVKINNQYDVIDYKMQKIIMEYIVNFNSLLNISNIEVTRSQLFISQGLISKEIAHFSCIQVPS